MNARTGKEILEVVETMEAIARGEKAVILVQSAASKERLLGLFPLLPPESVTYKGEHEVLGAKP
jgi:hypothetical protein